MKKIISIISIIVLFNTTAGFAQSAFTQSLGGGTAFTRGARAAFWNTANLGLRDDNSPAFSMMLYSVSLDAWNSTFSRKMYDKYIGTGQKEYLDDSEIDDILSEIPDDGFKLNMRADASVLAFTVNNFAFSIEASGLSNADLPKSVFELFLKGNKKQQYDVKFDGTGYAYSKAKFSYGRVIARDKPLTMPGNKELLLKRVSFGGGLSYLYGGAYFEVLKNSANLSIEPEGIGSNMDFMTRQVVGGSGMCVDIGISAETYDNWMFGAAIDNILGSINWNGTNKETFVNLDLGDPKTILDEGGLLDLKKEDVFSDTTLDASPFTKSIPINYRFAAAKKGKHYLTNVELGVDREEFFFSFGAAYIMSFFKVYTGYSNRLDSHFSFGIAFDSKHFYFDLGAKNIGGINQGSIKGIGVGTALGFAF